MRTKQRISLSIDSDVAAALGRLDNKSAFINRLIRQNLEAVSNA